MKQIQPRPLCYLLSGYSFALIALAVFIEYQFIVPPCSLCILQRIVYAALGVFFLLAALINSKIVNKYFIIVIAGLLCFIGMLLASRQLWLEANPPLADAPAVCVAGLFKLLDKYTMLEALSMSLKGSGNCSEVTMRIFGLSLAGWSLLNFCAIFIGACYIAYTQFRDHLR